MDNWPAGRWLTSERMQTRSREVVVCEWKGPSVVFPRLPRRWKVRHVIRREYTRVVKLELCGMSIDTSRYHDREETLVTARITQANVVFHIVRNFSFNFTNDIVTVLPLHVYGIRFLKLRYQTGRKESDVFDRICYHNQWLVLNSFVISILVKVHYLLLFHYPLYYPICNFDLVSWYRFISFSIIFLLNNKYKLQNTI